MTVPTRAQSPSAPVFPKRDLRDPTLLGWALLVWSRDDKAPLSETYDRGALLLERVPAWSDHGLMSNDPSTHHSKTSQTPAPGGAA